MTVSTVCSKSSKFSCLFAFQFPVAFFLLFEMLSVECKAIGARAARITAVIGDGWLRYSHPKTTTKEKRKKNVPQLCLFQLTLTTVGTCTTYFFIAQVPLKCSTDHRFLHNFYSPLIRTFDIINLEHNKSYSSKLKALNRALLSTVSNSVQFHFIS